ncbi:MAG: hypothetical protein R2758_03920 [Bacteroidales bacterium]
MNSRAIDSSGFSVNAFTLVKVLVTADRLKVGPNIPVTGLRPVRLYPAVSRASFPAKVRLHS